MFVAVCVELLIDQAVSFHLGFFLWDERRRVVEKEGPSRQVLLTSDDDSQSEVPKVVGRARVLKQRQPTALTCCCSLTR